MTLANVQGNVICGYGSQFAHFVFAKITDPAAARDWLARRLERITYNESWEDERPQYTVNVGFTYAGLVALGVPGGRFEGDDLAAFREGMAARSVALGDQGESGSANWQPGLCDTHIVISLASWEPGPLDGLRAEQAEELVGPGNGLALSFAQTASTLDRNKREHFGFRDGFSQPSIAGAVTGPRDGEGVLTKWRRWRDLALGEFVLGHEDEGGLEAPAPAGPLGRDATFMVVRKLEQDVGAFRTYIGARAEQLGRDEEWVAAKMLGRWRNGSSLVKYPDAPGPDATDARGDTNDFRYGTDPDGHACPLGAHVRRANPRDALGWQSRLSQRHRLLRRGISYGPPLLEDEQERGLMFVCFQSSIERQFEFVQKQWLGDGNVFGLGDDRDPLVGGSSAGGRNEMVIQGSPPVFLSGLPEFVTVRGGDYYLVPGRTGLAALAAGSA